MRQLCCLCWQKINIKRYGGSPAAFVLRGCSSFPNRLDAGGAIQCTDSGRENALRQSCRLRWQKINIKQYGWKLYRFAFRGCSSFPDGFARLELSALAERFDAQIRVEKTVYLCLRESCIDTFHVIPFDYTRNLLAK